MDQNISETLHSAQFVHYGFGENTFFRKFNKKIAFVRGEAEAHPAHQDLANIDYAFDAQLQEFLR